MENWLVLLILAVVFLVFALVAVIFTGANDYKINKCQKRRYKKALAECMRTMKLCIEQNRQLPKASYEAAHKAYTDAAKVLYIKPGTEGELLAKLAALEAMEAGE